MVSINYSSREVCCKIVYYGPGLSGKTTNLLYVHSKVPSDTRGKMISLATEADRTLYFDFLPINIGTINGLAAKFQLYTVPGQVYYNATRKLVLRGVDGVVFVADSQPDKMDENIESLSNLEENLEEYGYDLNELPFVIQYNKCDLPGVLSPEEMNPRLNPSNRPSYVASATVGNGVFDTLKGIIKLVLDKAKNTAASPQRQTTVVTEQPPEEPVQRQSSVPDTQPVAQASEAEEEHQSTGQTATAVEDAPAEENYRPYPGSMSQKINVSKPTEVSNPTGSETSDNNAAFKEPTFAVSDSGSGSPKMAPSVKKRKEKKRGFFKRMFGIK
ncbi:MAG: GTPase [Calditrichaeota bacterium]|nr:MAG: GTPase [Calditrichota bacterium]